MKLNPKINSSRRKARKKHFTSNNTERRIIMSSSLSKELKAEFGIRTIPIHKDDQVIVKSGTHKGTKTKVSSVYRKKFVVYLDQIKREKANGTSVFVGIHPSNLTIISLNMTKTREKAIKKRQEAKIASKKEMDLN